VFWGVGALVVAAGLLVPVLVGSDPAAVPLVLGTELVLGLCALTLWLCRRWIRGGVVKSVEGGEFEILESLALGSVCQVHLVKVGDRHLLAGMDAAGLKVLLPLQGLVEEQPDALERAA
jgi:flagellar biogenesis protein FliO